MSRTISDHTIDVENVSSNAVAVVEALRDSGYDAYLVGGCVRDLLLGRTPKDFDVATNATPEQVTTVFPKARLIGRRFRIAHVRMRREVFEVSTFRRHIDDDGPVFDDLDHEAENGIILRDNVYGTLDEDAFRRDFTVNALYYDPVDNTIIDYVDGMTDVESGTLRLIGDPEKRFREDPVRILRALRFTAKLEFALEPATEAAIAPVCEFLTAIPAARLLDEFTKLFMHGSAVKAFELLEAHELVEILFPLPSSTLPLVMAALRNTDERIREDKPVTPAFLRAALLWEEYRLRCDETATGRNAQDGENNAALAVISEQQHTIAIPKRYAMFIRDVWQLQPRLEKRSPKSLQRLLEHRRFRAGYDFLVLRSQSGDADPELAKWWTDIQELDPEARAQKVRKHAPRRRRRRRRPRSEAAQASPQS